MFILHHDVNAKKACDTVFVVGRVRRHAGWVWPSPAPPPTREALAPSDKVPKVSFVLHGLQLVKTGSQGVLHMIEGFHSCNPFHLPLSDLVEVDSSASFLLQRPQVYKDKVLRQCSRDFFNERNPPRPIRCPQIRPGRMFA